MNHSTPGLPVLHQLPEFTQTHVHRVGDAIQPSHPLSSPSPPAPKPSQHQGLFQWVSSSHQVAKYWSFSFNNSPSNEYPGLISFRMDWLDLLAVQGTLKSLLQHHSSKASIYSYRSLKKLGIKLPYDLTIPLLSIWPEKTVIEKNTCTPVFIAAVFTIAKTWKKPRWNLERWYWWTYLHGSSGNAEMREKTCGQSGEREGGTNWESSMETCTIPYVK